MSSNFKCMKCLEWCTDLPSKEHPQESPVFFLKGNEYFIRFVLECTPIINQVFFGNTSNMQWYFTAYLQLKSKNVDFEQVLNEYNVGFKTEGTLSLGKGSFKISKNSKIWCMDMKELCLKLPSDYMTGNNIKFLFNFNNLDESLLKIKKETEDKCIQTGSYLNAVVPLESTSEDFCKLLDEDVNHDAEIKCGEHSFKAHKVILSARSEVFKAMLESDMLEGRTGIVEIKDIDISYVQDFVRYLYTGEMPELTYDKAKIFYEAGDKYAVRSLMLRCSEYLQDNISQEKTFECFALADAHSDQKLKDRVKTYILAEKMYLQDELWQPFCESYPKIALEVYRLSHKRKISECEDE